MATSEQRNRAAQVDPAQVRPYASAEHHLRDELWRVWLRVEHEIRRRWEIHSAAALPRSNP